MADADQVRIAELERQVAFLRRQMIALNLINTHIVSVFLKTNGKEDFGRRVDTLFDAVKSNANNIAEEFHVEDEQ